MHTALSLSASQRCDSQKLTENTGSVRTLRKSTVSCAQACTFCSLSVCLYLSLAACLTRIHAHTHAHYRTHTTPFSPNTHGGERLVAGNVKLLCHVQSQSGSLTTVCVCVCVQRVCVCVCSAETSNPRSALLVWAVS